MVDSKQIKSASELDYSPIPTQKRWTNIRYITVGLGVSALFSIAIAVLGGLTANFSAGPAGSITGLVVAINSLLIIPLVFATIVSGIIMLLTTSDFIGKYVPIFASANGFTAQERNYTINKDGTIFSIGDSPTEKNIITGNYRGFDFELFEHNYWTGSGKNRTQHSLSILDLKLPKKVPNLVIDSKLEDSAGYSGSVLPIVFDHDQKITLEGDFSRYFDVYSPRNYQVSALALLTPDVMQTFLTKLNQVDIELVNNRLYIYDPDSMNSAEQIEDMFLAADAVINEWSAKLRRANIYATKQQEQINTSENSQPVRLKRGGIIAVVVTVVVVLAFNILRIVGETNDNPWFIIPFMLILPVALIAIIINQIIVARRRTAFTKRYGPINK